MFGASVRSATSLVLIMRPFKGSVHAPSRARERQDRRFTAMSARSGLTTGSTDERLQHGADPLLLIA